MNPITFNEPFAQILSELVAQHGFCSPTWKWPVAPLFNYSLSEQRETELCEWRKEHPDFELRLPFETVRLSLTQIDTDAPQRGKYRADFVAATTDEKLYCLVRIKTLFDRFLPGGITKPLDFVITDVDWQSKIPNDDAVVGGYLVFYNAMGRYDGKWLTQPMNPNLEAALGSMINGAMNTLIAFAIDATLPGTHIATVHPDQPGRSVQWVQARTHYTLISHGHPANNAGVRHGGFVQVDQTAELHRMAHSRRAHFRTLKAERFRFAKGTQVFVRSAWVGPKEWRDGGSRQIYRILEPVTQQRASYHAAEK